LGVSFQGGDMGSRANHPDFFCLKSRRTSGDLSWLDAFKDDDTKSISEVARLLDISDALVDNISLIFFYLKLSIATNCTSKINILVRTKLVSC
jgi:hypothetical protein